MSATAFHFESYEAFSPFSDVGQYRAADYWQLPEGAPIELIKGRFVVSPSPNVLHQVIVSLLWEVLRAAARKTGSIAMFAPMDVILSDDTILQPDVLYVSKARRSIVKQRIDGPPDLVIEIISGTSRRDRVEKLDLYAQYGVGEYRIVDPQAQMIEFLVNEGGRFVVQSPINDCYQISAASRGFYSSGRVLARSGRADVQRLRSAMDAASEPSELISPARCELPPLRIHHLLAWMTVTAVLISVSLWFDRTARNGPPIESQVVVSSLILGAIAIAGAWTCVGWGVLWRR